MRKKKKKKTLFVLFDAARRGEKIGYKIFNAWHCLVRTAITAYIIICIDSMNNGNY